MTAVGRSCVVLTNKHLCLKSHYSIVLDFTGEMFKRLYLRKFAANIFEIRRTCVSLVLITMLKKVKMSFK